MSDIPHPTAAVRAGAARTLAIGLALVCAATAAGGGLVLAARTYIDRTVQREVADALAGERLAAAVRGAAIEAVRGSPAVLADTLNRFIADQQREAKLKENEQYRAALAAAKPSADIPSAGAADAALVVTYFFDANCPYCKQMEPVIERLTRPGSGVRVVFREIPILGPPSERAARFASALWRTEPGKYLAFHQALMSARGHIDEAAVDRIASVTLGDDLARRVAAAAAADADGAVTGPIKADLAIAQKAGVHGTPFIALGDKTFLAGAMSAEDFLQALAEAMPTEPTAAAKTPG